MFFYAIISFLITIFFQLVVGSLAMSNKIKFSFGWLTLINCILIICITYVFAQVIIPREEGPQCGISQLATFSLGLGALGLQLLISILQLLWLAVMKQVRMKR